MSLENPQALSEMPDFPSEAGEMPLKAGNLHMVHWVAGAVLGLVLMFTAWSFFQVWNVKGDLKAVTEQTQAAQTQLDQIKAEHLDAVIAAQQTVEQVKASDLAWSNVLAKLLEVTPLDVFYRSYTGSPDGKLTLSALSDDYDSAAQLVSILTQTSPFNDVFSSSLTRGSAESGSQVVSFGVTFNAR